MVRILIVAAWLLLGLPAFAQPPAARLETRSGPPIGYGRLVDHPAFPSRHVAPRDVAVWLPPGYERGAARYPVVYMHDGQNLFLSERANFKVEWDVDGALGAAIAARRARPAIVVGIASTDRRGQEYLPDGFIHALSPAMGREVEAFHGGPALSDAYLAFVFEELKPFIDGAYRTKPGRADTLMAGSSMGGLISLYALTRYPEALGGVAAISTHWPLVRPDVSNREGDWRSRMIDAQTGYLARYLPPPEATRIWLDHGALNLDAFYAPYQREIDRTLAALGYRSGPGFSSRVYDGTDHNEAAWADRAGEILAFLLGPPER